jgi:hypothetical protein
MKTLRALRNRLSSELPGFEFTPSIIGLDVIETPPEQITLMMTEFRAREAELARQHYSAMDDVGRVCETKAPYRRALPPLPVGAVDTESFAADRVAA